MADDNKRDDHDDDNIHKSETEMDTQAPSDEVTDASLESDVEDEEKASGTEAPQDDVETVDAELVSEDEADAALDSAEDIDADQPTNENESGKSPGNSKGSALPFVVAGVLGGIVLGAVLIANGGKQDGLIANDDGILISDSSTAETILFPQPRNAQGPIPGAGDAERVAALQETAEETSDNPGPQEDDPAQSADSDEETGTPAPAQETASNTDDDQDGAEAKPSEAAVALVTALNTFSTARAEQRAQEAEASAQAAQAAEDERVAQEARIAEETRAREEAEAAAEEQARAEAEALAQAEEEERLRAEEEERARQQAEAEAEALAQAEAAAEAEAAAQAEAEAQVAAVSEEARQRVAALRQLAKTRADERAAAAEDTGEPRQESPQTTDEPPASVAPVAAIPEERIATLRDEIVADVSTIVQSASNDVRQGVRSEVLAETEQVIETRLAQTERALQQTEQNIGSQLNQTQAALQQTEQRLAQIQSSLTQQQEASQAQISALDNRISQIQTRDINVARTGALLIALSELGDNIDSGRPFRRQLNAVEAIAGNRTPLSSIRPYAEDGIPTNDQLRSSFSETARNALAAEAKGEASGIFETMIANISGLFTIRPVGDVEGDSTGAIIARAEQHVKADDMNAAAKELSSLEGSAKTEFASWIAAAEAKAAAEGGLRSLEEQLTATRRG
ncbi:MAG: hypothetical protein AAF788_03565 [Pseudomonadota bacterium]